MSSEFETHIAKITSTSLGYEDHGILTVWLTLDFGGGSMQGAGGYALDVWSEDDRRRIGTAYGCEFIARVIKACGVDSWEKIKGRTVFALKAPGMGPVLGIENLPTEPGRRFVFADLAADLGVAA